MNLPTRQQCFELMDTHKLPENVRAHCNMANKVAVLIAQELRKKGIDVNVELVDCASLLHDLFRPSDFTDLDDMDPDDENVKYWKHLNKKYSHTHHGIAAHDELKGQYPEMALLIRKHGVDSIYNLNTFEEKIVNYSDTRGFNYEIIPLVTRFNDFRKRHAEFFVMIVKQLGPQYTADNVLKRYKEIEKELFSYLDIGPDDVKDCID